MMINHGIIAVEPSFFSQIHLSLILAVLVLLSGALISADPQVSGDLSRCFRTFQARWLHGRAGCQPTCQCFVACSAAKKTWTYLTDWSIEAMVEGEELHSPKLLGTWRKVVKVFCVCVSMHLRWFQQNALCRATCQIALVDGFTEHSKWPS